MVFTKHSPVSGPQWFSPWTDICLRPHPLASFRSPALDVTGTGISVVANESQQSSWTDKSKSASFCWLTNVVRVLGECFAH